MTVRLLVAICHQDSWRASRPASETDHGNLRRPNELTVRVVFKSALNRREDHRA